MPGQLETLILAAIVGVLASLPGLLLTYSQRKIKTDADKADVTVDREALSVKQQAFLFDLALERNEAQKEARKAREAAERAEATTVESKAIAATAVAKTAELQAKVDELVESDTGKQGKIVSMEQQIEQLKAQVEDLKAQQAVTKEDSNKKDGIIAERDATALLDKTEISRLYAELVAMAKLLPPQYQQQYQYPPQQPAPFVPTAPAITPGTEAIQQIEIVNPDDRPVPVIDKPAPDMDAHNAAGSEQNARATAELEKRLAASEAQTPPPDIEPAA